MTPDLNKLTIKDTLKHFKKGDFSPSDIAEAYLKAIEEKNPKLNAYLEVFEDVQEKAREADERFKEGKARPLEGIPLAIKDNILIKGKKASAASKILENHTASYDATVIEKLRDAGAIFLGRTNLDEFAMGSSTESSAYGATLNPLDEERVSGGSSGGSAAAVAGNLALAALGSDTAGSIRQPASFCGVVGLKPTYGGVSRSGLIALGSSLDVIGPITKTVEDAEILFKIIEGQDPLDSTTYPEGQYKKEETSKEKKELTIGLPTFAFMAEGLDPRVLQNYKESVQKLGSLGFHVKEINLPHIKYSVPAYYIILPAEASANLARFDGVKYGLRKEGDDLLGTYLKSRGEGFGKEPRRRILIGTYVLSAGYADQYYNKAQAVRQLIRKDFEEAWGEVDLIAMPTTPGPAFKLGEKGGDPVKMYLEDIFTVPANHAGIPAISIPSGEVEEEGANLPLGLELMAPHGREDLIFSVGKKFLGK